MELQITHQPLAPIQANLDQIKEYVQGVVNKYQNITYTDEQMKMAKADRADLKHLKEDIDNKRKQVKAAWNAPYLEFESKIKAITALIDQPVALIDGQIKAWEESRRAERRVMLEALFNGWNSLGPLLAFDRVLESEMLKLSITDSKAKTLLISKMEQVQKDISALESTLEDKYRTPVLAVFCRTLSLTEALAEQAKLKSEEEKQNAILGEVVPQPVQAPIPPHVQEPIEEDIFATPNDFVETRRFAITGKASQINRLFEAAREIGIKMREVF